MQRKDAGDRGEALALDYLRKAGLQLVLRNYRCRQGEIDLVMFEGRTLALIEVRYRAGAEFGGAAASVTHTKQQRLAYAARHLLMTRADLRRHPARFDVVAIDGADGAHIQWIRNAFTL